MDRCLFISMQMAEFRDSLGGETGESFTSKVISRSPIHPGPALPSCFPMLELSLKLCPSVSSEGGVWTPRVTVSLHLTFSELRSGFLQTVHVVQHLQISRYDTFHSSSITKMNGPSLLQDSLFPTDQSHILSSKPHPAMLLKTGPDYFTCCYCTSINIHI